MARYELNSLTSGGGDEAGVPYAIDLGQTLNNAGNNRTISQVATNVTNDHTDVRTSVKKTPPEIF